MRNRPAITIHGTLGAVSKPLEIDFDPHRGIVVHQEFHSAGDNLVGWASVLINEGIAFTYTKSPIVSIIRATYSGGVLGFNDVPQPNWQVIGNETQKTVLASGIAAAGLLSFPKLIQHVKLGVAALEQGNEAFEEDLRNSLADGEVRYYDYLQLKLLKGETHFAVGQYALRRTISFSNFYTGDGMPDESGAEGIYAMSDILGLGMPAVQQAQLASIFIPSSPAGYAWSWRRLPSQSTTGAQNRVEVSTEWWWDAWDTKLYGGPLGGASI